MAWTALACLLLLLSVASSEARTLWTLDLYPLREFDRKDPELRKQRWDLLHAASTLQGIVNRKSPKLYLTLVGDHGATDRYWWGKMRAPGAWLADDQIKELASVEAALKVFRNQVTGAVVWDERVPATANLASTLAGVYDAVALRYSEDPKSLYHRWIVDPTGPQLKVAHSFVGPDGQSLFTGKGTIPGTKRESTGSTKCDAYLWAIDKLVLTGKVSPEHLGYYPDAFWLQRPGDIGLERTLLSNHDWIVAHRGLVFDLGPWLDTPVDDDPGQKLGEDGRTFRELLKACRAKAKQPIHIAGFTPWDQKYCDFTGGPKGGVETEWHTVDIATCYDAFLDADAAGLHAMANASFFQHFPLKERYEQKNLPTRETVAAKGWLGAQKPFVTLYVGDYDSAAWLYEMMPSLWDDPARGSIPLGWAFNPVLERRFPLGLAHTRATASPNDTFVAGDSGAGYVNPGALEPPREHSGLESGLERWAAFSRPLMKRWDLKITGFVIDGDAPAMNDEVKKTYAELSPGGVFAQKVPEMSLVDGVPLLRMGSDLPAEVEQAAQFIANEAPKGQAWFRQYRTVLWSPTKHKQLMDRVKELRPDIEWVDPHALTILAKEHFSRQN